LEVVYPFFAAGLELGVKASCLQALEDFGICMLFLPVAPGVSDRSETDVDANRCTVLPEQSAGELAAVIGDDAVGHTKMAYQPTDELDGRPGLNGAHRSHLHPLGELVDGKRRGSDSPLLLEGMDPGCPAPKQRRTK
jgi:hypothetical protein